MNFGFKQNMNVAGQARANLDISDLWRGFKLVTSYMFVFSVLYFSFLDTKYSFDIYRFYALLKIVRIAAYVYGVFFFLSILSRIFGFSVFDMLKKFEYLVFVFPRIIMMRPLVVGMGEARIFLLLTHFVYSVASTLFYLFILPLSIITTKSYMDYALINAIYILLPGVFFGRGLFARLKHSALIFVTVIMAGLIVVGLFGLAGITFASQPGNAPSMKFLLVVLTLAGVLVTGFFNNINRHNGFLGYLGLRISVIYSTVITTCFYPLLAGVIIMNFFLLIVYIGVIGLFYYNYLPWAVLFLLAAGVAIYKRNGEHRNVRIAYYLLFVITLAHIVMYIKATPSGETCADIGSYKGELKRVLSFDDMKALEREYGMYGAPYDLAFDAELETLLVAFKNRGGNGNLLLHSLRPGARDVVLKTVFEDDPNRIMFPERLQLDTAKKLFYVTIKSPARYSLCRGSYADGALKILECLNFGKDEIVNSFLLPNGNGIAVLFTSSPGKPSIRFYDTDPMKFVRRIDYDNAQIADHIAYDSNHNRLIMPSVAITNILTGNHIYTYSLNKTGDIGNANLAKVTPESLLYKIRTLYGVAYNRTLDRIYTASLISHQILVFDGDSMKLLEEIPTGDYTRNLGFLESTQLLYIANCGDGTLDVMDASNNEIIRSYKIGPMARSLTADPVSGRVFAISACGVYEIKVDRRNTFRVDRRYRLLYTEYILDIVNAIKGIMPQNAG